VSRRFFFSSALDQLPSPAPQIAVLSKGPQNVVRALHRWRSQITVSFLADVQLRFVSAPHQGTSISSFSGHSMRTFPRLFLTAPIR
jgi:hypothetical protein